MQEPLKILVVRFSSIGDIVLTTPVVRMLKKQLNAQVHYLTKSAYISLLNNNPYIDFVYQNISSEQKEKFFIEQASHNLFTPNPDRKLIFEKVDAFLKQFRNG